MGIRVHKTIGYGLTDVQAADFKITDPRINHDKVLRDYENEWPSNSDYKAYLDALPKDEHKLSPAYLDRMFLVDKERGDVTDRRALRRDLDDCVIYQPEYGLSNVLQLQPLACHDWSRYDDGIDWIEETYFQIEGNQADRAVPIPHGIYPFNASYMDARTGERIKDGDGGYGHSAVMSWVRMVSAIRAGHADITDKHLDLLARAAGFDNHADATANCVPTVPEEVKAIADFLELFTDDTVWRQLRPLLYVYWG